MVDYRRVGTSIILGALLGVLCIVGVGQRIFAGDYMGNWLYLIGMWYNRVVMGLVIGLAGEIVIIKSDSEKNLPNALLRGLLLGIFVSSAIFISDAYQDVMSLLAGFAYGIVIDLAATYLQKS